MWLRFKLASVKQYLECGGLTPLWFLPANERFQSGVKPPHSKTWKETMAHEPTDSEQEIAELLDQALAEYRVKGSIDVTVWQSRYPHLADQLPSLLEAVGDLDRAANHWKLPEFSPPELSPGDTGYDEWLLNATTAPPLDEAGDGQGYPGVDERGVAVRSARRMSLPRQFGDYELLEEIARGGMGVVYKARQLSLNRIVAVKMILAGQLASEADIKRFRTEAEAAAHLQHPNIVAIHQVGEAAGQHFFSMDYVEGTSLAALVRENPLPAKQAAAIMQTVAEAVYYAHTKGIIHRDLKPANVLMQMAESRGQRAESQKADEDRGHAVSLALSSPPSALRPKITDFGVAKRLEVDSGQTSTGAIMGTPSYMSPEQAAGKANEVGAASDVYALGATLYELVTGRPPFRAETPYATVRQVLESEPVSLRLLNQSIDRDLETITLKCLAKEPTRRYASAAALADDLRRYLTGEPIVARPVSTLERAWRWSRRHPSAASAVAAVVAAVVILAVAVVEISGKNRQLIAAIADRDNANTQLATSNDQLKEANAAEHAATQTAEAKRQEAEQARDETKQVLDSLVSFFRKPDPDADGEKLTVAELLGQAVEQMDKNFPNQPLIQAPLLSAIGQTYLGLGLYQKAITAFDRARDLLREELGEEHEDTLASMSNLAEAYRTAGRLAVALPLFEQALELKKSKLGPDDSETLVLMNNLAAGYSSAGRLQKALSLYEQLLELKKARLGPEHPSTLTSMNNLAVVYASAGRLTDSLSLHQKTLELMKAQYGLEHPNTLQAMNSLAEAYRSAGRLADALSLHKETLELRKAKLGPQHPDMLTSMNNLALTYTSAGRLAEALPLQEQTLELMTSKLGGEHPSTLTSMNNLALAYESAGRRVDALPLHEKTLEMTKVQLGPEHPDTLASMNNLARAYYLAGRLADALPLLEETLKLMDVKLGPEHPTTLNTMHGLAKSYLMAEHPEKALPLFDQLLAAHRKQASTGDRGFAGLLARVSLDLLQHHQYPAAETHLRECLMIREKQLPDDWSLFNTKSMLGGALAGQKKFQEAEPLLVEGYSGMKDREAKIPAAAKTRLAEAIRLLVDLYTAWDRPEEAEKWRAKLPSPEK